MGCNGSKQDDIRRDRERQRPSSRHSKGSSGPRRTQALGIGVDTAPQTDDTKQYGTSLTDRYVEEKDFLRGIIEKTHQTFVDVSMEPSLLDEKEAEERGHKYQIECSRADLGQETILPLPTLVSLGHSSQSFKKAFQEPLVEQKEKIQFLEKVQTLSSHCRGMAISSSGKPLAVTFDSL